MTDSAPTRPAPLAVDEEAVRALETSKADLDEARKKIEALERDEAEALALADARCAEKAFLEDELAAITRERDELRDADPVDEWLAERDKRIAAELQLSARDAEIMELKYHVTAFLAPWAVLYQMDHGLDGLHPVHFDILAKCGARMDDFKRAAIAATVTEKGRP